MSFSVSNLRYGSVHRQPPTLYYPPNLRNKPVINSLLFLPWLLPQLEGPWDQVYATWTYDQATSLSPTCTYWWRYCLTSRRGIHRRYMFVLANELQTVSRKFQEHRVEVSAGWLLACSLGSLNIWTSCFMAEGGWLHKRGLKQGLCHMESSIHSSLLRSKDRIGVCDWFRSYSFSLTSLTDERTLHQFKEKDKCLI